MDSPGGLQSKTYVYVTLTPRIDLTLPHAHPTPLWQIEGVKSRNAKSARYDEALIKFNGAQQIVG